MEPCNVYSFILHTMPNSIYYLGKPPKALHINNSHLLEVTHILKQKKAPVYI